MQDKNYHVFCARFCSYRFALVRKGMIYKGQHGKLWKRE